MTEIERAVEERERGKGGERNSMQDTKNEEWSEKGMKRGCLKHTYVQMQGDAGKNSQGW